MSVLAGPARGFKLAIAAMLVLLIACLLDVVVAVRWFRADSLAELQTVMRWTGYLHLLQAVAMAILFVGVAQNVPELRRRRWSIKAPVVALLGFTAAFAVHVWLYRLLADAASFDLERMLLGDLADQLAKVPERMLLATAGQVGGLVATVVVIRAYALTDGDLGLREQARNVGGMLVLLLVADTFYRFTYGLGGGGMVFGAMGLIAGIGLYAFWVWSYFAAGRLFDGIHLRLRDGEPVPVAAVVRGASLPAAAPAAPAAAPATKPAAPAAKPAAPTVKPAAPVVPLATAAPTTEAPTPIDGGPRTLR